MEGDENRHPVVHYGFLYLGVPLTFMIPAFNRYHSIGCKLDLDL